MTKRPVYGWPIASIAIVLAAVAGVAQQSPRIPLREGLTIVTAVHMEIGDFESIKRIVSVTDESVQMTYSADMPASGAGLGMGSSKPGEVRHTRAKRTIRRQDLRDAHEYAESFNENQPPVLPGTTALGVSAAALTDLKTKGATHLTAMAGGVAGGMANALSGLLGGVLSGSGGRSNKDLEGLGKISGELKRVEPSPVMIAVLVNDQQVSLPAIHAKGELGDNDAEFYFLDDPENPLSLRFNIGDERLTVVKIAFPPDVAHTTAADQSARAGAAPAPAAPQIERALEKTGRAEVYGIYFDFASARIKDESEPVLKEIADVMTKNPAWKLKVEGHTDNIGGDPYNLDLSKKRAAAVKDALVTRYHIDAGRLLPEGFGATQPKDTNDTLEGRARNRRVELVRESA